MPVLNLRDKSRTTGGKTYNMVTKVTTPPKDQGGWMAMTSDLLKSAAYRSLSPNARKVLDRLIIEHIDNGRRSNGTLIVTHDQFYAFGVTAEYIADAQDELEYKGLIKVQRGRAGNGTAHPSVFTLTFDGTSEGACATNEWKRFTLQEAKFWSEVVRHQLKEKRSAIGRKRKSSLRDSEIRPLRDSEISARK